MWSGRLFIAVSSQQMAQYVCNVCRDFSSGPKTFLVAWFKRPPEIVDHSAYLLSSLLTRPCSDLMGCQTDFTGRDQSDQIPEFWMSSIMWSCQIQPFPERHSSHSSPAFFFSKPAMWAPHLSCLVPSRDRGRWCWTWRWSRSTTSSTSEAAPSSAWRYLSQSTRSEAPEWTLIASNDQAALLCSWYNGSFETAHLPLFIFQIIMSSSIKTLLIKTQISWWESNPVLKSPPWFNGH